MGRAYFLRLVVGALLLFAVPAIAFAEEAVETAQLIIKQQIDAFLRDDARTAFSFA
jgi:hypothetical protein